QHQIPAVASRAWSAECLAELGEFAQGIARGDEAVRIAEAVDHAFSLVGAYHRVGNLYLLKGDVEKAIPLLQRALSVCQAAEIRLLFGHIVMALGYAYALAGRVGEGLPLLEQGVELAASIHLVFHSLAVTRLSEAYLLSGRVQDASDQAAYALTLARE